MTCNLVMQLQVWGASMVAVGAASAGFHASTGKWRTLGRRLDYWSIALSSNLMMRALFPGMPSAVTVSSMDAHEGAACCAAS